LKFGRNLYFAVAGIVAFTLLAGGLAQWQNLGYHVPLHHTVRGVGYPTVAGSAGSEHLHRLGPFLLACYIVAAVGVILLGWHWFMLARKITSIANHISKKISDFRFPILDFEKIDNRQSTIVNIDNMDEALTQWLNSCSDYTSGLENQIKDLQVRLQLSQRREAHTEAIIYSIHDAVIVIDEYEKRS
jgi:hypothetical protein